MESNEHITVAAAEVGKHYVVTICQSGSDYTAEVSRRDKTHTYLKHKHGEAALPNNITLDLIALKPYEERSTDPAPRPARRKAKA